MQSVFKHCAQRTRHTRHTQHTRCKRHAQQPLQRAVALVTTLARLCASGLASATGATCSAHSPAHRVALVELYSSEGCNSCAPADARLGQWKDSGAMHSAVPLVDGMAQISSDIRLDDAGSNGNGNHDRRLNAERARVAAFVENAATGDVLQVAELAFCP